jgi:hypothetical protein
MRGLPLFLAAGALSLLAACSSTPERPARVATPGPDFSRPEPIQQVLVHYSVKPEGSLPPAHLSGDGSMSRTALLNDHETIARLWGALSVKERREGVFCDGFSFNWVQVQLQPKAPGKDPESVLFHFHRPDALLADASGTELIVSDDFYKAMLAYLRQREGGKAVGLVEDNDELHLK